MESEAGIKNNLGKTSVTKKVTNLGDGKKSSLLTKFKNGLVNYYKGPGRKVVRI